ncbi:MAG: hypothetical protein IJI27_05330 [Oscillospiraceae bacterium]|nr:hypothetical protein [Oscillospiraceae bacterium]
MYDFGYGVDLSTSKANWKDGCEKTVFLKAIKHKELKDYWDAFLEAIQDGPDNLELPPHEPTDEDIETFVDEFEEDLHGWCGVEGMLAEIINLERFDGHDVFAYEDCCLYVGARIPKDDAERQKMPTMEEIQSILAEYLAPLLEEPLPLEFLEIHD